MSPKKILSAIVTITLPLIAAAQGTAPARSRLAIEAMAQPPIPSDPLESVMSEAQAVQTPEQRQAVMALIDKARALTNVRAYPYDLKTNFNTFGSSSSDGAWSLEDISPARKVYRWTAQGPNYSVVHLYNDNILYSDQPAGVIPLRLTQVREALFFAYPAIGPYASLRTAAGSVNGVAVECILAAQLAGGRTFSGARNWGESEYCVDPQRNLLTTYSPVPGLYVHYDYSNAIRFHDKLIPGAFTISEAGRSVIEASTASVSDPSGLNPALFTPSGLSSLGVGPVMTQPVRVRSFSGIDAGQITAKGSLDVVVVVAVSSPDGHITEAEIVASSNPSLNQSGLERARDWQGRGSTQSGASPQSQEVIFTFEFPTPQS